MSKTKTAAPDVPAPAPAPGPAPAPTANGGGGGDGQLALATHDELAALGMTDDELGDDGLAQVDRDDIKIPAYALNVKGKGPDGRPLDFSAYYNTVDETRKLTVNAAFLHLHKSNLYSKWNEPKNQTDVICRSYDRITGTMTADGRERPCEGCPDAVWYRDNDGKRRKNCSPVYNVFAVDRDTSTPFVVRFKRTALPVIKTYLQKHHIGRRIVKGVRLNYPLHVFSVELTSTMSDNGNYAIPILTRGKLLERGEVMSLAANAKVLREQVLGILSHVETVAESREGAADDGGDTSFEPEKYAADVGKDFVA